MRKTALWVGVLFLAASCRAPERAGGLAAEASRKDDLRPTITRKQSRAVAAAIFNRDVRLWVECNVPDWTLERLYGSDFPFPLPGPPDRTILEQTIESVRAWSNISGRAVVTSKAPHFERVYARLSLELPDVQITPGLKLWEYLPRGNDYDFLADREVWTAFAGDALKAAALTGSPDVVIMAEGPMSAFYASRQGLQYTPNYRRFADAMAPLRSTGLRFIWYPFGPHGPRPILHGVALVEAIRAAVPDSWFTGVGDGWPDAEHDHDANERRVRQRQATGGREYHHMFVAADGRYVWSSGDSRATYTPEAFAIWLRDRSLGGVWVFPGTYGAASLGRAIESLVIPAGFRVVD